MAMMNPDSTISNLPEHCATIIGVIAAIIYCILGTFAIFRSASSTAAIGFVILPFEAIIILLVFAFFGFWIGVLAQGVLDYRQRYSPRLFLAVIITVPAMFLFVTFGAELFSAYRDVNRISSMNTQELDQAFVKRPTHSLYGYDIFLLAAIAHNPNASGTLLDKIAHLDDPRINDSLGSIINLTKENRKGLAVIRLVVRNPNVSTKTLVFLTDSNNYNLLGDLAENPKLPVEFLRKLFRRAQTNPDGFLIEWGLAYNPTTPPDILRMLAKKIQYGKGFDVINSALSNNPGTPEDVKKLLFK